MVVDDKSMRLIGRHYHPQLLGVRSEHSARVALSNLPATDDGSLGNAILLIYLR